MKQLMTTNKKPIHYEFAIKRELLLNGTELYIPIVRRKRRFYTDQWERITCIYGHYLLMDLLWEPQLTKAECEQHIESYKKQLHNECANFIETVEFLYEY